MSEKKPDPEEQANLELLRQKIRDNEMERCLGSSYVPSAEDTPPPKPVEKKKKKE